MHRYQVRIRVSYEVVTPESAEQGDADERGWVDEEGAIYGLCEAETHLRNEGIQQASCYPLTADDVAHAWLTGFPSTDYRTGAETTHDYHIEGHPRAKLALFRALGLVRV